MRSIYLVAFMALAFNAHAQRYGDWSVTKSPEYVSAEVRNESGGSFGMLCSTGTTNCIWAIIQRDECTEGHEYPVLVNSDSGAVLDTLTCGVRTVDGDYMLTFGNFDAIGTAARKGTRVGFAIPLASGEFKVNRFSLSGSTAAITAASEQTIKANKTSTRDIRL